MTRRLPAEWARQSGVMLTWPHALRGWGPYLDVVEPVFVRIASEICRREALLVVCYDSLHRQRIAALLSEADIDLTRLRFALVPSDDSWARDHGPICVLDDGQPRVLNFTFNGWGNKYPARLDNAITGELVKAGLLAGLPAETVDWVLEGGAIETDGQGSLLTTTSCLLSPSRNPAMNQTRIEQALQQTLGVERILWLTHGHLEGDDTDGHVDTLARFCNPDTIAYVACDDPQDSHYAELKAMEQELQALRTPTGQPYTLIPLPWPQARLSPSGQRLPATYANFLIINEAVLVPTYEDPADAAALACLAPAFPGREIIGIPCRSLILQYGSLHCVTMQLPEGVLARDGHTP